MKSAMMMMMMTERKIIPIVEAVIHREIAVKVQIKWQQSKTRINDLFAYVPAYGVMTASCWKYCRTLAL